MSIFFKGYVFRFKKVIDTTVKNTDFNYHLIMKHISVLELLVYNSLIVINPK